MNFVERGLAIAGLREALDQSQLQEHRVEAILQLYTLPPERLAPSFPCETLNLQVRDREPLSNDVLRQGIAFIGEHRAAGRTVLVVCGAGTSRSVSFIAGYLYSQGVSLSQAFDRIAKVRPNIQPHRRLIESLVEHLGVEEPLEEVCAAARSRG